MGTATANIDTRLNAAKTALAEVEAEAAAEQRAQDVSQLEQVRAAIREGTDRVRELERQVLRLDEEIDQRRQSLEQLNERIAAHAARKPELLEILPRDPECSEWKDVAARLQTSHTKLIAELRALSDKAEPARMECLELAASVNSLLFSERNLRSRLLGRGPSTKSWFEGSVRSV